MVVSFKIFKKGARYKPISSTAKKAENGGDFYNLRTGKINGDLSKRLVDNGEAEHDTTCMPVSTIYSAQLELPEEYDISFTLSLFQDGYLIRKSTGMENFLSLQQDEKSLHPYDKASEALFSAIHTGLLPGDILDDIPSNYINGAIVCEIRDYRKCNLEQETSNYASSGCTVSKVRLRMSLENVVKDIPQLADDSWTYRDLLEVESRIVKAMQPQLHLSPTPKLDRLCSDPCPDKLNLGIVRKRPLRNPEVAATTKRKKTCGNEASNTDNLNSEGQGIVSNNAIIMSVQDTNGSLSSVSNNFVQQPSSRSTLPSQPQGKTQTPNFSGANTNVTGVQNLSGSYSDIMNGNVNTIGKRENPDPQIPTVQSLKRAKPNLGGLDGIQQQQFNTQFVNQNIQDMNLKNQLMRSHLEANGTQYNASRYPSSVITSQDTNNFYFNHQGMRPVKIEQIDPIRNPLPPMQWQNNSKDVMRKDDMLQKKKTLPSPRVSSGMVHSPVSSKSGEFSSGSGAFGSQKATTNSNAAIGMVSAASSPNDSVQRQQQTQAKRKSNSASKTQIMSGVGSPASVSNMNAPVSATSPSTTNVPVDDQLERFAKITMLTQRFQANTKRNKVDQFPTKRNIGRLNHDVASSLNDAFGAVDFIDETKPMSASLVGGNINISKSRVMIFSRTESNQDVINRRLGMMEKQSDGTVFMQYGDADGPKFPTLYDPFLMLPNVQYADLLADQFTKLILKENYQKTDDQVHPVSFYNAIPVPQNEIASELQLESTQGQPLPNMLAQSYTSNISNNNPQMLASRNNPALPMAQNYFSRAQQFNQSSLQQHLLHQQQQQQQQQQQLPQQQQQLLQQQQQQPQLQLPQLPRSNPILSQNPLTQLIGPNANPSSLNLNPLMTNKTTAQPIHLLQQQNNPMHRKMMPGPNNMGNLGMVGLGSNINNIMGMSGIRPMQGMNSIRPMQGISGGIRQPISQDQAAAIQRMKMNRMAGAGVYGGIPTYKLGPAMNRINLSQQLQRSAMASMGPPKIPGPNFYQQMAPQQMAQQQQQQQQQQLNSQQMSSQQQQMSLQMSQQQILNQQQQISSPLQQQMSPQLSSGAMQQQMSNGNNNNNNMNNSNVGGNVGVLGPGSPQLSSQTHGSIGSITSSPMDMQGPK